MALTNEQTILLSQLILQSIQLQQSVTDATLKDILAHVISRLHGILWS